MLVVVDNEDQKIVTKVLLLGRKEKEGGEDFPGRKKLTLEITGFDEDKMMPENNGSFRHYQYTKKSHSYVEMLKETEMLKRHVLFVLSYIQQYPPSQRQFPSRERL